MSPAQTPVLTPNWKRVLTRAHSVRAMYGVVVFEGLNVAWPYVQDYVPVSKVTLGLIAMGLSMAAIYFRITYQPKLHESKNEPA